MCNWRYELTWLLLSRNMRWHLVRSRMLSPISSASAQLGLMFQVPFSTQTAAWLQKSMTSYLDGRSITRICWIAHRPRHYRCLPVQQQRLNESDSSIDCSLAVEEEVASAGSDGLTWLTHIFQPVWLSGIIPDDWHRCASSWKSIKARRGNTIVATIGELLCCPFPEKLLHTFYSTGSAKEDPAWEWFCTRQIHIDRIITLNIVHHWTTNQSGQHSDLKAAFDSVKCSALEPAQRSWFSTRNQRLPATVHRYYQLHQSRQMQLGVIFYTG